MKSYLFIVKGRVQGVYYRATIKNRADDLGIKGYAKNLTDGTVEVVVNMDKTLIDKFIKILKKGSLVSRVDDVEMQVLEEEKSFDNFYIL